MRRRRLQCNVLGVAAFALLVAVLLYRYSGARGFTRQDFLAIREGMTLAEIEKVLGCPPGNYTTGRTVDDWSALPSGREDFGTLRWHFSKVALWQSDTGRISIAFDANGKAFSGFFLPMPRIRFWEQGVLD